MTMPAVSKADTITGPQRVTVFQRGDDNYAAFRIPALTVAGNGEVLAFAEARRVGDRDQGDIDLVLRRSTDGGATWSDLQLVGERGEHTYGNPTPILARDNTIHLLTTSNHGEDVKHAIRAGTSHDIRRVHYQRSTDHGHTWTPPREITDQATPVGADWRWYATGPGHGIQLTHGPHAGRLVAPANHSDHDRPTDSPQEATNASHVLLSDDGGQTWRVGGIVPATGPQIRPWEATVAQLPDGRIVLNARNQPVDAAPRVQAVSDDGGESFGPPRLVPELVEPSRFSGGCQGSLLYDAGRGVLWFSNPAATEQRENLTVRRSDDGGQTWNAGVVIHAGPSGYSDLTLLPDGTLGLLFENGETRYNGRISFVRVEASSPAEPAP